MLALRGLPGIYFHSLFGSRGWPEGAAQTGRARTINREKLDVAALEREVGQPGHRRRLVFERYRRLLAARAASAAFHPLGGQEVLAAGDAVFALLRRSPDGSAAALCLHNVSAAPQAVDLDVREPFGAATGQLHDLIDGQTLRVDNSGSARLTLAPYQVRWLSATPPAPRERRGAA
jgi:sucrose phosphorylase